jgi:hypothetical protein
MSGLHIKPEALPRIEAKRTGRVLQVSSREIRDEYYEVIEDVLYYYVLLYFKVIN